MATIKNVIETKFTTAGAGNTVNAAESVNKAQTRLGQSSASAGRSFAAQSQGLGGLVAAYAGAAATVFALQQAFAALAAAAQSDTIIQGTKTLAAEIGQSGPRILASIKEITQGQLTLTEAAQNANIALSAGFNTKQIEGFTEVALKASRALGRDLSDSFTRIVRGVSKLEPELLDELGIFTRIEAATQRYARQLGVATNSLNEFQRRQAFANAAIEEGIRKFGGIDTTVGSTQKTLEQLRVQVLELGTELAKVIVGSLEPLVKFFTGDFGNALLLFGGLLALTFKKSTEVIGGFVGTSLNNLTRLSDFLADKGKFDTSVLSSLTTDIKKPVGEGGLKGIRTKALISQDPEQAKRFKEALELQREGSVQTVSQLNKVNQAYKEQQAVLEGLGKTTSDSYKNLNAAILRNDEAIKNADKRTKGFIATSNLLKTAVSGVTKAFAVLGSAVNILFTLVTISQLVGDIFGVDLIGAVKEFFTKTSEAAENAKTGFTGLVSAVSGGSAVLVASLKSIGASDTYLEKLPETLSAIKESIDNTITASKIPVAPGGFGGAIAVDQQITDAERILEVQKRIQDARATVAGGTGLLTSQDDINAAQLTLVLLDKILQSYTQFGTQYEKITGEISRSTGLSGEQIGLAFSNNNISAIQATTNSLRVFGVEITKINDSYTLDGLTDSQAKLVESAFLATNSIESLGESIAAGALTSEKFSQQIGGLQSQLDLATIAYNEQNYRIKNNIGVTTELLAANFELGNSITYLSSKIDFYEKLNQKLIAVETTYKGLTKTFSKEITLLDTAVFDGIISQTGVIARNQDQINVNQNEFLASVLETNKASADVVSGLIKIEDIIPGAVLSADQLAEAQLLVNQRAELYNKALQAVTGRFVELINNTRKLADEFEKETTKIQKDLSDLLDKQAIVKIQLELDATNLQLDAVEQGIKNTISQAQADIELINAKKENKKIDGVDAAKQIIAKQEQILKEQFKLAAIEFQRADAEITAKDKILNQQITIDTKAVRARESIAKAEATARYNAQKAQNQAFSNLITSQNSLNSNFLTSLANVYSQAANQMSKALGIFGGTNVGGPINPGYLPAEFQDANASLDTAFNDNIKAISAYADAEAAALVDVFLMEKANLDATRKIAEDNFANQNALLRTQGETQKEVGEAAIRAAKEAGAANAEKLKELEKQYKDLIDGMADKLQTAITTVIEFVGEKLVASQQAKVDQLKAQEELANGVLAFQTERLNQAQSQLNDALSKETSLKEELVDLTKSLVESQASYIASIGDTNNRSIAQSSQQFISDLIAQKRKTIEVGAAVRSRIALEEQVRSLEETKIEVEQYLEEVTQARIEAEEKLAKLQERLAAVTDIASGKIGDFIRNLSGFGLLSGSTGGNVLSSLVGKITGIDAAGNLANDINEAGELLGKLSNQMSVQQFENMQMQNSIGGMLKQSSQALNSVVGKLGDSAGFLGKIAGPLSGLAGGFGIGSTIGGLIGDKTLGSSIGGAIGGIIAKLPLGATIGKAISGFASKALTGIAGKAIGSAAGAALGTAMNFVLPVIGSLIGGLLGKLFRKKPRASATGELTEDGFSTISLAEKKVAGGTAKSLLSISETVLTGVVTALNQVGIAFKDVVRTSIAMKEGSITGASLSFANGKSFSSGGLGSGQDAAKKAAEFYSESFFEGLRVERNSAGAITFRSLVVDALIPNASDIQAALDNFAELADTELKTQQLFTKVLDFSTKFNKTITDLLGTSALTAERVYPLIEEAASESAYSILKYYEQLRTNTEETFGRTSVQYAELNRALELNALAQIGLTKDTNGAVVTTDSLSNSINAGSLAIKNIVANTTAMTRVFEGLGYTAQAAASIVQKGLVASLTSFVSDFGDSIKTALDMLTNPDSQATKGLIDLVKNAKERVLQAQGVYDELLVSQGQTAQKITNTSKAILNTQTNLAQIDAKVSAERVKATTLAFERAQKEELFNSAEYQYYRSFSKKRLFGGRKYPLRGISDALAEEIANLKNQETAAQASIQKLSSDRIGLIAVQAELEKSLNSLQGSLSLMSPVMSEAASNIQDAVALQAAEVDAYIRQLTKGQLRAIIAATDSIELIYRSAAANRLLALEASDAAEAFKSFMGITKDFKKSLSEITGVDFAATFTTSIGSLFLLAEKLGKTDIDPTVRQFGSLLTNISNGNNIADNFVSALGLLLTEFEGGTKNAEYFVKALDELQNTTADAISVLKNLSDAYRDTIDKLRSAYQESKDLLVDAVQGFGDSILNELENFSSKSVEILRIYDGIVSDISTSGNSLLSLKDEASKALADATAAVLEFERANKLSGRSSSQIRTEIANIEAQINSLLAAPMSLSTFREYSSLSAAQMALNSELSTLTAKEAEYAKLLQDRAIASSDLAKTDKIIADLGSSLVDARSSETDVVQKAIELQQTFIQAQKDRVLAEEKLAEAGFNLNQARVDETDRVLQLSKALADANNSLTALRNSVSGLTTSNASLDQLRAQLVDAAKANAEIAYASLPDADRLVKVAQAAAQAETSFNSIKDVILNTATALSSSQALMPTINALTGNQADSLATASSSLVSLVNSFSSTNTNSINSLVNAVQNFADTSTQILSVNGLAASISSLNATAGTSAEKVQSLIANLLTLTDSFSTLGYNISTNPTAALNQISDTLTSTAYQVQAAWDALTLEFNSNVNSLQQAVSNMNVAGSITIQPGSSVGLSEVENQSLTAIANNTKNFPYLTEVGREKYSVGQYASGGFVGRDRVLSLLEPGEFVLRKAAVEKIGTDNAIKLNSTGSLDSAGDVQVNITNNGTPVETAATPDIRRVNGKIIVDILLEDLRNNGPIKRQIRSLR